MRSTRKLLPAALAAALAMTVVAADTMAQTPPAGFEGKDKTYELSGGSQLRAGGGLTDRLLYTVWERTTVVGSGPCSDGACPLTFNGKQVYARRSRLTLAAPAGAPTASTPSASQPAAGDGRYPPGWSRLQRGDKGDNVKRLQDLLIKDGAKLTADGNFGRGTEAAVRDLQKRKGLKADGVVGFETLRALGI